MKHPRRRGRKETQRKPRERVERTVIVPQAESLRARRYQAPDGHGVVTFYRGKFTEVQTEKQTARAFAPMPANVRRAYDEARARARKTR